MGRIAIAIGLVVCFACTAHAHTSIQDVLLRRPSRNCVEAPRPKVTPKPQIDPMPVPVPCDVCKSDCCKCEHAPKCECTNLVDELVKQVGENSRLEQRNAELAVELGETRVVLACTEAKLSKSEDDRKLSDELARQYRMFSISLFLALLGVFVVVVTWKKGAPACALLVLALMGGQVFGQETTGHLVGPVSASFKSGWRTYRPLYDAQEVESDVGSSTQTLGSTTLRDIFAHLDSPEINRLHAKYGKDIATWGHECVHSINTRLSKQEGPSVWAFYCLGDRGAAFRDLRITKPMVEQLVPQPMRGTDCWNLYMTGMNPDTPMVIIDEWVAYLASAQINNELHGKTTRITSAGVNIIDRDYAMQFATYATALLQAIDRYEPTYPDKQQLTDFIAWNVERTLALVQHAPTARSVKFFTTNYFRGGAPACFGPNCGQVIYDGGQYYRPDYPAPAPPTSRPVVQQPAQPPMKPVQPPQVVKGDRGEQGPKGETGATGATGPPGKPGEVDQAKLEEAIQKAVEKAIANMPKEANEPCRCGADLDNEDIKAIIIAAIDERLDAIKCKCKEPDAETRPSDEPVYFTIEPLNEGK